MGCLASKGKGKKPGKDAPADKKLIEVCIEGDVKGVQQALDRGEDVNQTDFNYRTGLMEAAGNNYPAIVKILIARGADVNKLNKNGGSNALHYCVSRHDDVTVTKMLVEAGCDPNAQEVMHGMLGKTPLAMAATKGRRAQVEYLCSVPTLDLHKAGSSGKTADELADDCGFHDIATVIRAAQVRRPLAR